MKPKALITGGCGFVGRHMCHRLFEEGYYVVAVDNLISEGSLHPDDWPKHLYINDSMDFVYMDMTCEEFFQGDVEYFGKNPKWDLIVHLAAVVGGRNMIENEPLQVAKDLEIDSRFFTWVTQLVTRPGMIVYFSSSAAYPLDLQKATNYRSLKEEDIIINETGGFIGMPDLSYGWAKLTGEFLAQLVRKKYDIPVAIYRPFSGFGEDQADCYPFPAILKKCLLGDEVEIWSDSFRDFVYIEDIIDCVLITMNDVAKQKTSLNICSGIATSFSELSHMIAEVIGKDIIVTVANNKPKGVYYRVGDNTNAASMGWAPKYSLKEAIERICKYYLYSI